MQVFNRYKHKRMTSFTTRLFLCIFTTAFLLLVVGELVLFGMSIRESKQMNSALTKANMDVTVRNVEQLLMQIENSVQLAFAQRGVLLATQADWEQDYKSKEMVKDALIVAMASNDTICHMSLCRADGAMITTQVHGGTYKLPYQDAQSWDNYFGLEEEYVRDNRQTWYFLQTNPFHISDFAITNVREITPLLGNPQKMQLAVSVSERKLAETYEGLGQSSFLVSKDGVVISAVNKDLIGTKVSKSICDSLQGVKEATYLSSGDEGYLYAGYLPQISCYLVMCSSASVLSSAIIVMVITTITILILGLIFSLIWSKYTSVIITKPILKMKSTMEIARQGNWRVRCDTGLLDEIGYLQESFNHMMDSLCDQIEQLNEQQNLVKETEIRLLQSQINPHLLYNTLDSAQYLLSNNDTVRSTEILKQLSKYFKMALQRGNKIVTMQNVVEHIEAYLQLQNLCRGKNFELQVDGDARLLQANILHMLIQPVVENSVLHGFEGNYSDGLIRIELQEKEGRLQIRITDNGMGMTDEEITVLRTMMGEAKPMGRSFALWNIAQRIRMHYGSQYFIQVESEFGEYTTFTIEIPLQIDDKESEYVQVDDCR